MYNPGMNVTIVAYGYSCHA